MDENQASPAPTAAPVAIVTAGMLLQMLLQIALQSIMSRRLGAGQAVDAYEAAVAIPLVMSSMVTLPLGAILIPLVTRIREKSGDDASWRAASTLTFVVLAATVGLAAILCLGRTAILPALYSLSEGKLQVASQVLLLVAWLIPTNAFIGLSLGIHHWRGSFALPAAAGVIGPAVTLGMLASTNPVTVQDLARATIVGAVTSVVLQLPLLLRHLHRAFSTEALRTASWLVGPVLLGAIYWRIDPLIDRSIVSGFDQDGTLASLGYCTRVTNAMAAIASGGLSVVAFPRMAAAASRSDLDLARETSRAIGSSLLILIPLVTAWFLFGEAIVRDLFEGGRFTPADTARVALFIRCAIGVVIGGSVGEIFSRTFYAQHDTVTPVLVGTACVTVGFGLKWIFSRIWGPSGVLIASSLGIMLSASIQFITLRRRLGTEFRTYFFSDGLSAVIATAAACGTGWAVLQTGVRLPALAGGGAGLVVYLGVLTQLRRRQSRSIV